MALAKGKGKKVVYSSW